MVVEQHPITTALLNICFMGTLYVNQNILRGLEYIYIYIKRADFMQETMMFCYVVLPLEKEVNTHKLR